MKKLKNKKKKGGVINITKRKKDLGPEKKSEMGYGKKEELAQVGRGGGLNLKVCARSIVFGLFVGQQKKHLQSSLYFSIFIGFLSDFFTRMGKLNRLQAKPLR